jgi:hypothetical protein
MEMIDSLASIPPNIDNNPITIVHQSLGACNFRRLDKEMTHQGMIVGRHVRQGGNLPSRDQENMDRGLRIDVSESQAKIVFVHYIGWDLPSNNLLEDCHVYILANFATKRKRLRCFTSMDCPYLFFFFCRRIPSRCDFEAQIS